jgi:hypothetical protein
MILQHTYQKGLTFTTFYKIFTRKIIIIRKYHFYSNLKKEGWIK